MILMPLWPTVKTPLLQFFESREPHGPDHLQKSPEKDTSRDPARLPVPCRHAVATSSGNLLGILSFFFATGYMLSTYGVACGDHPIELHGVSDMKGGLGTKIAVSIASQRHGAGHWQCFQSHINDHNLVIMALWRNTVCPVSTRARIEAHEREH